MQKQDVIMVEGLRKTYGPIKAVDGVTFQVRRGEIFGMVGPNGSGKTTTIECIEGLRRSDEGRLQVLDLDPQKDYYELRERTGVQLQNSNLPPRMRVEEALDLFSSFYRQRADYHQPNDMRPILKELGLEDKRRTFFSQLSGGQKQRLFVALALINRPEIVFLDELTTGLDPQARRATWDLVGEIRERGTTVFLTTHFMDEAERLCDRVLILDHGRVIALDTPQNLVSQLGMGMRISFALNGHIPSTGKGSTNKQTKPVFNTALIGVLSGVRRVEQQGDEIVIYGQEEGLIGAVIRILEEEQIPFHDLRSEQATLEDAFLALTGQKMRD
jgi:ABC-2 type transport system ATP-binding protein